jgi:pimeloyl-ACP methyl ester carboxylesterase
MQTRLAVPALLFALSFASPTYAVDDPPLETAQATLDAGLMCTGFVHPDKPPVLLVHGTFTNGEEQYTWTYLPLLAARGFDVCTVTYPDRGLGDQQISAEYVVNALRKIRAQSGRKVAMIGHSQGASMPRWALKWWKSARDAVDDFVLEAGPNHGTRRAAPGGFGGANPVGMPAAFFQFQPKSNFVAAVNRGDETPGEISYTSLYSMFDELVEPSAPIPTAALDWQKGNPNVANIRLQDVCPGRFVDHLSIGLTDRLAFRLTMDAILNAGPANVQRAGGASELCGLADIVPNQIIAPNPVQKMLKVLQDESQNGAFPPFHRVTEEPPLKPYAQ